MVNRLFGSTVFICIIYLANSQINDQWKEDLLKLKDIVCQDNLTAEYSAITNECDQDVPSIIKHSYLNCVRQSINITNITLPFVCYSYMPGGDKVKECLNEKSKLATVLGFNMEAIRTKVLNRFLNCIKTKIELKKRQDETGITSIISAKVVQESIFSNSALKLE